MNFSQGSSERKKNIIKVKVKSRRTRIFEQIIEGYHMNALAQRLLVLFCYFHATSAFVVVVVVVVVMVQEPYRLKTQAQTVKCHCSLPSVKPYRTRIICPRRHLPSALQDESREVTCPVIRHVTV